MPRWDATILPRIFEAEREIRRGIGLDLPFGFVIDLAALGLMLRYELIHTIYIYIYAEFIFYSSFSSIDTFDSCMQAQTNRTIRSPILNYYPIYLERIELYIYIRLVERTC